MPLSWQTAHLAYRPVPQDGLPVVGQTSVNGLYTAVMHSGVTLAPIIAEILSAEVCDAPLTNSQASLIVPYWPARFQSA